MNLTQNEITKLKEAYSKKDTDNGAAWNDMVSKIKKARGGQYPPDWFAVAIIGIAEEGGTKESISIHQVV